MANEAFVWAKRSCYTICLHVPRSWFSKSCVPWLWWSCKPRTRTWRHIQVSNTYFIEHWQSSLFLPFENFVFFSRFMHSRLRTHAESIAFFGGGSREKAVSFFILQCSSKFYLSILWCFGTVCYLVLSFNLRFNQNSNYQVLYTYPITNLPVAKC
jgi:hypothetical protein